MYEPAPARPKKTNICRARTGCKGCRQRRKKCDEQKPTCGSCKKLNRACEPVSPKFQFRSVAEPTSKTGAPKQSHSPLDHPAQLFRFQEIHFSGQQTKRPRTSGSGAFPDDVLPPTPIKSPSSPADASTPLDLIRDVKREDGCISDHQGFDNTNGGRQLALSEIPLSGHGQWNTFIPDRGNLALTPTPTTLRPNPDPENVVTFYMNTWRDQCLPALHLSFRHFDALRNASPLITNIMATLSACRISRTLPQKRLFHPPESQSGLCFRPDAGHECVSGELYGAALRKMAVWSRRDFDSQPMLSLAVLVLFCYLESSMGNFQEFRIHCEGVEKLVSSYADCVSGPPGDGLLAAWTEVRMQSWWRRAYFGTPGFFRNPSASSIGPRLNELPIPARNRRAAILEILCESHRLNTLGIIARWDASGDGNEGSQFAPLQHQQLDSEHDLSVQLQCSRLSAWYDSLEPSDLPMPEEHEHWDSSISGEHEIQPLHFSSHNTAMSYAYYATAKIMQCHGPLLSLEASTPPEQIVSLHEETEAWIQLLLRIAAGIDWKCCIHYNVYTIGLAGLLLASAIRSRNLATGLWVQGWLEGRLRDHDRSFEEGNFPVFQILDAVRLVNHERREGRDVIALFQTVNDGGGSGKFGSYHSQRINTLLVYGRCRYSGQMLSYHVSI